MEIRKNLMAVSLCVFLGPLSYPQQEYVGKVNLNKKEKAFSLTSETDTLSVTIDKKSLTFNNKNDFLFINTNQNNYKLIYSDDKISIIKKKSHIEYSTNLSFTLIKGGKKILLKDKDGNSLAEANYELKKGIANYRILIYDNTITVELLSFTTNYLYRKSREENDANNSAYFYSIFFAYY